LASLYELAGQHDQAIERYRRMLTVAPNHAVALNNLAYSLAVHYPDKVQEAIALARKAYVSASGDPSVVDTLAWILHLSGDDAEARRLIAGATRSAPNNAQIQLHAAIIDAAAGAYDLAARELARAVEIDPQLETQPDVRALRTKLGRPATP
ncbi:MAG TPA: hypothetical protein VJK49_07960, partial [Candidatus Limnocylindrales bacterium]|nr:hypothetical protein [Candidatus Limnocylindrales bacterium]